jgi:acetyl esterase/lipase
VADLSADTDLQDLRDAFEALHGQFTPPPQVRVRPVNADGVASLLVGTRLQKPTLLYLHGGAFVMGSAFGYQSLVGALVAAVTESALVPEYRLAPEHPFPTALEDATRAYLWLVRNGAEPEQLTLAGDSSGAGLALSLLLSLKQQGRPLPGRAVLLSPGGVDLHTAALDRPADRPQPVVADERLRRFATCYLAGHPADDPLVSPVTADLSGLPPMLIQAGTGDPFVADAHRLAEHARRHGVPVRLELYPGRRTPSTSTGPSSRQPPTRSSRSAASSRASSATAKQVRSATPRARAARNDRVPPWRPGVPRSRSAGPVGDVEHSGAEASAAAPARTWADGPTPTRPHRVPRDPQPAGDLADRHPLGPPQPPDL